MRRKRIVKRMLTIVCIASILSSVLGGVGVGAKAKASANAKSKASVVTNAMKPLTTDDPNLLVYDGFDGELGSIKNQVLGEGFNNQDFEGEGTSDRIQVVATSPLKYKNLKSSNKYLSYVQGGYRMGRGMSIPSSAQENGKTLYMSTLMRISGTGQTAIEFTNSNGFWHGGTRMFSFGSLNTEEGAAGTNGFWGMRVQTGGTYTLQPAVVTTKRCDSTETVFVVIKIDYNDTTKVSMYLNPDITKNLPATADVSVDTTTSMRFRGMTMFGGGVFDMDEFRVGTTYESVAPLSSNKLPVTRVKLTAANDNVDSLKGATIMGSNESATSGFSPITTIPSDISNASIDLDNIENTNSYRYVKFYGNAGSYGKLAEMKIYSGDRQLNGTPFGTVAEDGHDADKAFDGDASTYYAGQVADDQYVGLDLGGDTSAAKPVVSVTPGRYETPISIELTCTTDASEIYYTIDGQTPTKSSTKYTQPIQVGMGEAVLLKAIAFCDGLYDSDMLAAGYGVGTDAPEVNGLSVYMLGNSLTDTIANGYLVSVAQNAGYTHQTFRWTIPGAAMMWLKSHQDGGFGTPWVVDPHGTSSTQTAEYSQLYTDGLYYNPDKASYACDVLKPLDVITVQPFNNGDFIGNSMDSCRYFYEGAKDFNPNIRFLIYGSWVSLSNDNIPGTFENGNVSYVEMNEYIADAMNEEYPDGKEINIIPNSQALELLKKEIKNGEFPGGVTDFIAFTANDANTDALHLSSAGQYLIALTAFTTMYKLSPVGRVNYKPDSITEEQATALKEIAYEANIKYPYSGVTLSDGVTPVPAATPTPKASAEPGTTTVPGQSTEPQVTAEPQPTAQITMAPGEFNEYGFDPSAAGASRFQTAIDTDADGVLEIGNAGQLYWFADYVNNASDKNIDAKLTADIDMSVGIPDGLAWTTIASTRAYVTTDNIINYGYMGDFDGNNKAINNLKNITPPSGGNSVGLFGTVGNGGTIHNLKMDGFVYNNASDFRGGAIAGQLVRDGVIRDCYINNSSVTIPVAGAAVGANYSGLVENVLVTNSTVSGVRTGHVVGDNNNDNRTLVGKIRNSFTDGSAIASSQAGTQETCEMNINDTRMASGAIAFALNANRETAIWGQNIDGNGDKDLLPILGGPTVYKHTETYYSNSATLDDGAALQALKTDAIAQIGSYKVFSEYRVEQQNQLQSMIDSGTSAINSATDSAGVANALSSTKMLMDTVKTDMQLREEDWEASGKYNLVKNDSFAQGTKYWNTSSLTAGCEILDSQYDSEKVMKMSAGPGRLVQLVSVVPGSMYKFSYKLQTDSGNPKMGVYAYNLAEGTFGNCLTNEASTGWSQPGGWLEVRGDYLVKDSSETRSAIFSAEGDVVAIALNASNSAPVYLDDIKLIGAKPDQNKEALNMRVNMVADKEYQYTTDNHEMVDLNGRQMVHLFKSDDGEGNFVGGGCVYKWTKVVPGRQYIVGGYKAAKELNQIAMYTVNESGELLTKLSGQNWQHPDARHYAMSDQGNISDRAKAYTAPEGVYGIAIVGENFGSDTNESWYSGFYVYDVTESYAFDADDVPTVTSEIVDSNVAGNTISIYTSTVDSTISIASHDGSKVEYFEDSACTDTASTALTGLSDTATTLYAKVYSNENARARVYTVKVIKSTDVAPDALLTAKTNAKKMLEEYKSADLYREAQKTELTNAVNAGKSQIDAATYIEGVQNALDYAKAQIDLIKTDAELTAEEQLETAKTTAKSLLDEYKNPNDYRQPQKNELENAITNGKAAITAAKDTDAVNAAVAAAKAVIDAIKTDAQLTVEEQLVVTKTNAKTELADYKNADDYRTAQKTELTNAINAGKSAIDAATDAVGVATALTNAKAVIDAIKTDAQLTAEEQLEAAKTAAKNDLAAYKNKNDYRSAQQTELTNAINAGKGAIDAAGDAGAIATALTNAKAAIDKIKTNAQLTAEELVTAKANAKDGLADYRSADLYREAQKVELTNAINAGNTAIDAATDATAVATALANAKTAIDAIKTDAQLDAAEALAQAIIDAKDELDTYKVPDDYREAQKTELANAIEAGKQAIDAATDTDAVNTALASAKNTIDAIKTDAELTAEEANATPTPVPETDTTPGTSATPGTGTTPGTDTTPGATSGTVPNASATAAPTTTPTSTPVVRGKVQKVKFAKAKIKVKVGKFATLKVKLTPAKGLSKAAKKVKWSIDKKGKKAVAFTKSTKKLVGKLSVKIKAKKKGKAKITCKAPNGKKAVCTVTVK